uniref:N/A n=1 Tax=Ganoderma boninense TaxID=34458 RepID=A0A5K1K526_9APHY|nr:N/A [Ganoderma boninense]
MPPQRQRWNVDILREILDNLAPPSFPFEKADDAGLQALARCARASPDLFEFAVDVLWRQVDSLTVVFNVLSPTFRKQKGRKNVNVYALEGSIPVESFSRLQFYAARIRKLAHRADLHRITPAALSVIHSHLEGAPLLPSLEVLHWTQRTSSDVLEILSMVPPSLRELCIAGLSEGGLVPWPTAIATSTTKYVFSQFIHDLSAAAPSLELLTLSGNIHSSSIVCLGDLAKLKSLSIINFAHHGFGSGYLPVLRSCAAFPLQEFGINLTDDEAFEGDVTGFHSLRTLRVHGTLSLVTRFLSHVSSPELTSFGAFVPRPDRWEDYRGCLSVLCIRFGSSLRSVRLSGSWTGNMASLARPIDTLAPLLALRQLEEVCIISGTGVALSLCAEGVATFAKAWPGLRDFRLLYQPVPAALPIDALSAFVEHCPRLQTLWLASVDFRGVAKRELDGCPKASTHGLKQLWLAGDVPKADGRRVAEFVDKMFPNVDLRPVDYPWHSSRNPDNWKRVLESLKEVKAERTGSSSALQVPQ